jgi:putative FmdB family regulatory protein
VPIYEYLCEDCGRIAEVVQKVGERPPRTCPECGGKKLARLVSRSAFQLKGGGWYSDLYSTPKKKGAAGEKPGEAPAGTSADKAAAPAAPPKEPPASPAKPGKKG